MRRHGALEARRTITEQGSTIAAGPELGAPRLRIVRTYKYLGSWLADDGAPAADPCHRSTSCLATYAPLAWKVFGAQALSRDARLNLFRSLCLSRLLFGVEVWFRFSALAYRKLDATYHRGLRRIAGMCQHGGTARSTNEAVRTMLCAPSLDCLLTRKRLLLVSAIIRSDLIHLKLLLGTASVGGCPNAWSAMVLEDLRLLYRYHSPKLNDLGDPLSSAEKWISFIQSFPSAFAQLVRRMHIVSMPRDKARPEQRENACPGSAAFPCAECGEVFPNRKSLLSHTRVKHSRWSDCARAVGPSSCCPVCCMQFSSRTRLIAHLSETRS